MITLAFAIYDEKAKAYNPPFFQSQIGQAIRTFSDLAKDPKTSIYAHQEDYSLYHIGQYDDSDAKLSNKSEPAILAKATDFNEPNKVI